MELEKAGEIVLRLRELPNDYLRIVAIGRLQSLRVITWIAGHKARIAQCVVDSRVKRSILSRVSRVCVTSSTFRSKLKLIPNTIALHTNSIIFPRIETCEKVPFFFLDVQRPLPDLFLFPF